MAIKEEDQFAANPHNSTWGSYLDVKMSINNVYIIIAWDFGSRTINIYYSTLSKLA